MYRTTALVAATLLAGGTLTVLAAPPDPKAAEASFTGTLARYTLAPKGEVDGFVLNDGTQVHIPKHLSSWLVFTARPGDPVAVQGSRREGGPVIEASEIRNQTSGAHLESSGPKPDKDEVRPLQVTGKVQFTLHGPKGEVNGAILEDGTVLHLPPHEAKDQAALLAPGKSLVAEGPAMTTPMGRVIDVKKLDPGSGPS